MTIDEIILKYDKIIRNTIYGRCEPDVADDRYQDTILNIMKYLDKINTLEPNHQRAYIITIAKHCANPKTKANRKLTTYGGWTNDDNEDTTEEWLLEDDTYNPEIMLEKEHELKQRSRAEDWDLITKDDNHRKRYHIPFEKYCKTYKMFQRSGFYHYYRTPDVKKSLSIFNKLRQRIQFNPSIKDLMPDTARGHNLFIMFGRSLLYLNQQPYYTNKTTLRQRRAKCQKTI